MSVIYERVALIGLGLIASSMAHAMRRAGVAGEITGYARSLETRAIAREIGLCDRVCDTAAEACEGADLVVLCVPVGAMGAVAAEIAPALKPGATVSDVGSVKRAVIEAVTPHLPEEVHFVPAHPLAGTEHSGPRSGFAELFDNRWCLIVPQEGSDRAAVERLARFWQALGSNTDEMEAEHHDLVLAVTSHAPHLIAYTMVGVADDLRRVTDSEVIKYSAADVARCVSQQQGGDAGDSRALHRGALRAATCHPHRRRRSPARLFHPHPRHPPQHHRGRAGRGCPRFRKGVTSRKVVRLLPEQIWLEFVPILHRLKGRFAAEG
jgi:cyclohexadieny/prephenate dehydrogenase